MNENSNPRTQQSPETSGQAGLKAERVQEALAAEARLKAERVQITLKDLPGWRLQHSARQIARTFEMQDVQQVARLLQYVAELGFAGGELPDVSLRGGKVTFLLPTFGSGAFLEASHFELAKALEIRS
jgi:pterin-4a-carbinolamine dehydratase